MPIHQPASGFVSHTLNTMDDDDLPDAVLVDEYAKGI
jgi:hypothetical protein